MRKLERMAIDLNEEMRPRVAEAMLEKFGIKVGIGFSLMTMRVVVSRSGGRDLTAEEHAWLEAWSKGYGAALGLVEEVA